MAYFKLRTPRPPVKTRRPPVRSSIQSTYFYDTDDGDDPDGDYVHACVYDDVRNEESIRKAWLLKALALCRHVWPSAKRDKFSVDYLGHGAFNSVFSISRKERSGQRHEYVLRIPEADQDITRTVGIHKYLTKYTNLKVPRVITWDATPSNPLQHVYIILERVPGKCLEDVWQDLPYGQKLVLAQEMAQLYHSIESITNPFAGVIKAHRQEAKHCDEAIDQIFVEAFGAGTAESHANPVNWDTPKDGILPIRRDHPHSSVSDIMLAIFKRRIYEKKNREITNEFTLRRYELCQRIVEDMVDMGLFDPQKGAVCLCHPDLFPRNIMVDFTPKITITGILDWDDAMFAPRFAGRVLPRWLWQSVPEGESGSYIHDTEPLDSRESEPDSPQNAEIKAEFDFTVGKDWVSEATSEWLRLARALLRFSREGLIHTPTFESIAIWKDKWVSLSTDAAENLYFWRVKRNLSIFQEPDEPFFNWKDDEEVSYWDEAAESRNRFARDLFNERLRWIISIPAIPSRSEEQQIGIDSSANSISDDDLVPSSANSDPPMLFSMEDSSIRERVHAATRFSLP
ncbi:kinase-like domain-containing protein [Annulohypoxylon truncatum]|uniref:kinase-like domain-containing protein n=1 Tax=Annulohypoxylon truncatum TaxID=327061 RepID=UPI00200774D2|nr:kinase-like domain-containing protein [Annulohypoxylon truncatum]KAI1211003.1 kinase-like domain-containing protein [Annulohypoxylon truncatum]